MSNEQWKWNSVTYYVDEESGEQIDKSEIGVNYTKVGLIDLNVKWDKENWIKTAIRTMGVKKIDAKQLDLWK